MKFKMKTNISFILVVGIYTDLLIFNDSSGGTEGDSEERQVLLMKTVDKNLSNF